VGGDVEVEVLGDGPLHDWTRAAHREGVDAELVVVPGVEAAVELGVAAHLELEVAALRLEREALGAGGGRGLWVGQGRRGGQHEEDQRRPRPGRDSYITI